MNRADRRKPLLPLVTQDPVTGGDLLVTRLESPETGLVIEGRFSLGWIGRLSPDQLEFVGLLLRNRGSVQKVATEIGVSYNTARSRMDAIVAAVGGPVAEVDRDRRAAVLEQLQAGEIRFEDAMALLRTAEDGQDIGPS